MRKFHNHSLAIEVHRYLSDAMEQGAEDASTAGELRTNFAGRLNVKGGHRSDVVSGFDMSGKKLELIAAVLLSSRQALSSSQRRVG